MLISSFLPNLGGMEVGLHNICLQIQALGWEPIILAPYPHVKALKALNVNLPYKVKSLPPKIWGIVSRAPKIGFFILHVYFLYLQKKHKFHFWHVTMGYPAGCAMVYHAERTKPHPKYLIRCAGEDIQTDKNIKYGARLDPKVDKIVRYYLPKATKMVAITDSVYNEYVSIGVPLENIYKIPNGVELKRFEQTFNRARKRKELGIEANEKLILSVGRNHPKKNYPFLLKSIAFLVRSGVVDFKLLCVGRNVSRLSENVSRLNLEDFVILVEETKTNLSSSNTEDFIRLPSENLVNIYQAADLFAFPSLKETFGIAIVEAMAAGLPVIVGDSDGCRDIVENGKWGLLCDTNDERSLANKLKMLLENPDLLIEFKSKSLERCKDFDWVNIARSYVELYEQSS